MSKKISIVMGTYNCADTIEESINSLLNQTHRNWELIVCDDCSIDNTYSILQNYKKKFPSKIILLNNEKNFKLAFTLNRCLEYATGFYVARMDGDDISAPDRLDKQVRYLERNPSIDLVGTAMQRFDNESFADIIYPIRKPDRYTLKDQIPFNHATILTYKYVYDELNGYTVAKRTMRSQDYDLWFRFFHKGFNGGNLLEPLYYVRENESAIKRRTFKVRLNAYKTTLIGFRLLKYPKTWYIRPTVQLFLKGLAPTKVILFYRKYQKIRFKKRLNK